MSNDTKTSLKMMGDSAGVVVVVWYRHHSEYVCYDFCYETFEHIVFFREC